MTAINPVSMPGPRKKTWRRTLLKICGLAVVAIIVTGLTSQRLSDGPTQFLPGGKLRSGPLVVEPSIDWTLIKNPYIELQLVEPMGSRMTGAMVYDGELYVPCDLGFMWRRFSGRQRWISQLIWTFKHWHKDALIDGRVVLRVDGKRYERQAVRVTDPVLLSALRLQLEQMAEKYLGKLPDVQTNPDDIWFFRMEARYLGASQSNVPG